jgi:hypothetical protein
MGMQNSHLALVGELVVAVGALTGEHALLGEEPAEAGQAFLHVGQVSGDLVQEQTLLGEEPAEVGLAFLELGEYLGDGLVTVHRIVVAHCVRVARL